MEMHQVRYFLAVARTLNFTRAAEECNITQPSLTRAVQKLEEELGGLLFRRERALTHLTDLGRMMMPHLERTYEAAQAAKALARGMGKAEVAPLSLGVSSALAAEELDRVIAAVAASLTGLELTLVGGASAELIELALKGDLDLVVVEAPEDGPDRLETWPLFRQTYAMVAPPDHRLAGAAAVGLAEVEGEAWIDGGDDGSLRLRRAAAAADLALAFRHRAGGGEVARRLVVAGLGVAVGGSPLGDARLAAIPFSGAAMQAQVVLAAVAGRRRPPAAEALLRAARGHGWGEW